MENRIPRDNYKIALLAGAGNMLSVLLPLAKQLPVFGFTPIFAARRFGSYRSFFDNKNPFKVKLISKSDGRLLNEYALRPARDRLKTLRSRKAFPLVSLESLGEYINPDQIAIAFICVEPGALPKVFDTIDAAVRRRIPVVLLANMCREKETLLAARSRLTPINGVIHRTSSGRRISGPNVLIDCEESGYVKFANTAVLHDIDAVVDGVRIQTLSNDHISRADQSKYLGINLADYLIATAAKDGIKDSDFSSRIIGDCIPDNLHADLLPMFRLIDFYTASEDSCAQRLSLMKTDTFGRILKTGAAGEAKLAYVRDKVAHVLPSRQQLTDIHAPPDIIAGHDIISSLLKQ